MQGIYYLGMLIGVAWLCVWLAMPRPRARDGFWIFDMRGDGPVATAEPDAERAAPSQRGQPRAPAIATIAGAARGWRERAAAARAAGDVQQPVPERRPAESRRVRGEPPAPPARRR